MGQGFFYYLYYHISRYAGKLVQLILNMYMLLFLLMGGGGGGVLANCIFFSSLGQS